MPGMAQPSREKPVRGTARVAFIAHLDTITAELAQGYTALAVYQRHQAKLGGSISYQQFARYVRQLREDGVVKSPLGRPPLSSLVQQRGRHQHPRLCHPLPSLNRRP